MLVPRKYFQLLCFAFFLYSLSKYWASLSPYRVDLADDAHSVTFLDHLGADAVGEPANSTLGFGAIFVVSASGSPRRERLIQAANVTEIDLVVPELPKWTEEDEAKFRSGLKEQDRDAGHGSIMAWFSHVHILKL